MRQAHEPFIDLQTLVELGDEYKDTILVSFHSISKGFYGECGRRGGYMELINLPKDVFAELVKLASIDLCSNLNGQICTALMMNPPQVRQQAARLFSNVKILSPVFISPDSSAS